MSDGTISFPVRTSHPTAPTTGRVKTYSYNDGGTIQPFFMLEDGIPRTLVGATGPIGPEGPQGIQGIQGPTGPAGEMTVEGAVFETGTVTLPNSATKQTIYSNVINHDVAGECFLLLGLAYRPHSTGNDMEFDIEYDGNVLIPESVEEGKDTSAVQSHLRSFPIGLGVQSAGAKTINLRFSKETTGGTAQLKAYSAIVVRY